jgi:hypothetical protein
MSRRNLVLRVRLWLFLILLFQADKPPIQSGLLAINMAQILTYQVVSNNPSSAAKILDLRDLVQISSPVAPFITTLVRDLPSEYIQEYAEYLSCMCSR